MSRGAASAVQATPSMTGATWYWYLPGTVPFTRNENCAVPPGSTIASSWTAGRVGLSQATPIPLSNSSLSSKKIPSRASAGVPLTQAADPVLRKMYTIVASAPLKTTGGADLRTSSALTCSGLGAATVGAAAAGTAT